MGGGLTGFLHSFLDPLFGGGHEESWQQLGAIPLETQNLYQAMQGENIASARNLSDLISQITKQQYATSKSLSDKVYSRADDVLSGRYNPTSSPAYAPMRKSVEGSYGSARENILSSLPTGGVQQEALSDLESNRASNLNDIMSQILTQELQGAYSLGAGATSQAVQGLSAASNPLAISGQMGGSLLEYIAQMMSQANYNKYGTNLGIF